MWSYGLINLIACKCDSKSDNSVIILHTYTHVTLQQVLLFLSDYYSLVETYTYAYILNLHVGGMCAEIAKLDFRPSYLIITFNPSRSNGGVSVAGGKRWMDGKIPQLKGFSIKVI